jgi:hypothetical protein
LCFVPVLWPLFVAQIKIYNSVPFFWLVITHGCWVRDHKIPLRLQQLRWLKRHCNLLLLLSDVCKMHGTHYNQMHTLLLQMWKWQAKKNVIKPH